MCVDVEVRREREGLAELAGRWAAWSAAQPLAELPTLASVSMYWLRSGGSINAQIACALGTSDLRRLIAWSEHLGADVRVELATYTGSYLHAEISAPGSTPVSLWDHLTGLDKAALVDVLDHDFTDGCSVLVRPSTLRCAADQVDRLAAGGKR